MKRQRFAWCLAAGLGAVAVARPSSAFALDEAEVGMEAYTDLRDSGEVLFDSPYYEHLNEVGSVISKTVADRYPYPMRFFIVKGDSPNSFSIPGGDIYVNEPLLRMASNRDELAGVLAHETGHMVLHHVAKSMKNAQGLGIIGTLGSIAAQVLLGPLASIPANVALGTALGAQDNNLSRHIEAQADEEGARILAATGVYNPYGMIWFFQKLNKLYGDRGALWLQDHPFNRDRIADLKRLFASDPKTFGKYKDTEAVDVAYW
ncbi:MAG: M48 family metalloprotease [Vulcanimicrobiaceae bacterium]